MLCIWSRPVAAVPGGPADPWHGHNCTMCLKMAEINRGNLIMANQHQLAGINTYAVAQPLAQLPDNAYGVGLMQSYFTHSPSVLFDFICSFCGAAL